MAYGVFMNNLRYIKDLLLKFKYRYVIGILFLLCVDVLQLVLPKVLGDVTDLLEGGSLTQAMLGTYAVIVVLIALGIAIFRFLFRYTLYGVSRSIELSFRNRFYAHLQKLSTNYFNIHKTGDIMAHATNDMSNVTMATGQGVIFAIDSLLIPVVSLFMMWNTAGFKLTAASFMPLFLRGIAAIFFMRVMQSRVLKQQEAFSDLTETARENFSGIRVVKAFVQEQNEIKKFEKANSLNKTANIKFVRLVSIMFPSVMAVSSVSFLIALWYGGIMVIEGSLTLGGFVAFNSYLGMLIWPITAIGWIAHIFQRGSVSLKRINTIMDEKPEIQDRSGTAVMETPPDHTGLNAIDSAEQNPPALQAEVSGLIEFRSLTFTYPGTDKPVLENINITIECGKTLAVVGRTGSGKTTLTNLIPRLLSVPAGTLFIDGTDINNIPLSTLRSSIGCVPQDTFLFSASISENIDFFRSFGSNEIENAARTARIYDNICEFPDQFDTFVGERGVTLSGGQKQRVAIARAVIGSPAILILDDCLSAVDANTEEEILEDLKAIMRDRTSIIVSHRISAVKDADEIIVLDDGRIVERGTHASLIEQEGYYKELYGKQLLAEQIEGGE
ncbi:MAG: ABC transporter ATP-binding protein [Clostridiaceae bacterium]